jgi:nucleotide-binding universal stress UspA family protein
MSFKDILVHVDSTSASRLRLRMAMSLARRFDGRISGLHVIPEPHIPPYFKPSVVERIAKIYAENARVAAKAAEALFHEEIRDCAAWSCFAGELAESIAERARFADLLILGQFDTENPPEISAFLLPAKVVFGTASPVLVVPGALTSGDIGKRVVAAWDGSREAARAIRDAMPLLKGAEQVLLLVVDPDRQGHLRDGPNATEFGTHLGQHGVRVAVEEVPSRSNSVSETLLAQAGEFGADLLVMGAYGHSPVWEFIVGGTTQDVLQSTGIPILMSR